MGSTYIALWYNEEERGCAVGKNVYREANPEKYNAGVRARGASRRNMMQKIKSDRGCFYCGEAHPAALDFHHRDGETKEFNVASMTYNYSLERTLREIEKCDVVCANCHRKRTHGG